MEDVFRRPDDDKRPSSVLHHHRRKKESHLDVATTSTVLPAWRFGKCDHAVRVENVADISNGMMPVVSVTFGVSNAVVFRWLVNPTGCYKVTGTLKVGTLGPHFGLTRE